MTLEAPFFELNTYPQVILALGTGGRPNRPGPEATSLGLSDEMWDLCKWCWSQNPEERPSVATVSKSVEAFVAHSRAEQDNA